MKKNKLNLPKGVIHNPDMTLPDAIVFLAERMGSLEQAMMDFDAQAVLRNEETKRLSHSITYMGNELSNMNENLYSMNQEMNFTDVLAALTITLRRQTHMWAEIHGIEEYGPGEEEDED